MVWVAGQELGNNRYRIESQLGEGGLGITYLARNQNGDRIVIKTLKDDLLNNPTLAAYRDKYLRDFWDEAGRLGKCRHRHIVGMENAFYEGELPCLVMEYVEGENLGERIQRLGKLAEAEALEYIQQVGEALIEVHSKNLLHRDIKPSNIMVRARTGEAVLIDFGIAREFNPDFTQQHTQAFTNGFSPIEQYAREERRGKFSDVYSLAATLYYLLTAEVPISAISRAAGVGLVPPKQYNRNISDTVNLAIIAGMEFEGGNRPQSLEDWLELLDAATAPTELEETIPVGINSPPNPVPSPSNPPQSQPVSFPPNPSSSPPIRLISVKGVDYRKLRDLLADRKWLEADEETWKVMLQAAGREKEGFIRVRDINLFPSEDLSTIDGLWVHYSGGQFGFSVQKQIYESLGGTRKYNGRIWRNFGICVGWRFPNSDGNYEWVTRRGFEWRNNDCLGYLPHLPWTDYMDYFVLDKEGVTWGKVSRWIFWLNLRLLVIGLLYFLLSGLFWLLKHQDFMPLFLGYIVNSYIILFIVYSILIPRIVLGPRCSALLSRPDLCGVAPNPMQPTPPIPLISAMGINYQTLQTFLATGHWKEAHNLTENLILIVAGRQGSGWLRREDIEKFPYEDLHTIDQLWVHYSNGRFGFSVQKRIYQSLGGTRQYNKKIWEDFSDRVGWLVNKEWLEESKLNFTINAPLGHLPTLPLSWQKEKEDIILIVWYLLSFLVCIGMRFFHSPVWVGGWFTVSWLIGFVYISLKKLSSSSSGLFFFWLLMMLFMYPMSFDNQWGLPKFSVYAWFLGNLALISWDLYEHQKPKLGKLVSILLSRQSL